MNITIFVVRPLTNRSFLQRLFKQQPKENALLELNNLLATQPILSIGPDEISSIESKYGVSLVDEFMLNVEEFYAVYWHNAIKIVDPERVQTAAHLSSLLNLPIHCVANLQEQIGEKYYKKVALSRLRKRRLDDTDTAFLADYARTLALTPNVSNRLLKACQEEVLNAFINPLRQSQRCSPESQMEIEQTMRSFATDSADAKKIRKEVNNWVQYWQLENQPLQPMDISSIALQKSEVCYFRAEHVQWMETRSAGKYSRSLELIQMGTLFLTNKRLVFEGALKTSTLPYDRILRNDSDDAGIQVHKDKGKNPTLVIPQHQTAFEIVINRLLNPLKL